MMNSVIQGLAAAALSRMDKDKSAKAAATVATTIARGEGHPALRRAAGLVAQILQSHDGPPPASQMQPAHAVGLTGAEAVHDPPHGPPKPTQEAVLRGPMDALNCGGFAFSLFNSAQLSVSKLDTDGAIGGFYELSAIAPFQWTALIGRGDFPVLPISIRRDAAEALMVSVGAIPAPGTPTAWCIR